MIFKRIKIGTPTSGIEYVDAGLGCNNPIKQVIAEAGRVFGDGMQLACIVSIGTGQKESTGYTKPDAFQKLLPTRLIKILKDIATNSGRVAEETNQEYRNKPGVYYRLDVDRGLQSIALDEWKRLGHVRATTKNYMKLANVDEQVDHIVEALTGFVSCETNELEKPGSH